MRWHRAVAVWLLIAAAETVHGTLRTLLVAPRIGDFRARQLAVATGSLIILAIAVATIRWIAPATRRQLVVIGAVWVVLTLAFEIGVGRALGFSWERLLSDYRLDRGGLMPLGLVFMAAAPWLAARLRRLPAAG